MRLRSALAVAAAAGLGILAGAPSAMADSHRHHTQGTFSYVWTDRHGERHGAELVDPQARDCIDLPQVTGDNVWRQPADSPRNRTDSTAVVFSDEGCDGAHFAMRPLTGYGSERLKVRSVLFS
ncbi:hypothetical protein KGQ20_27570 [Catenulispora sp. NF23]|uniref:Uncharacterized protein n=1 Tax=Catenulispora pinistramenti TaxID=2705254 RepID=A0ABS5KSB4_9ACTN|nr:hypothetical protein [Catenulispora pinistramenti]MBS2536527.1 hypothetical protein [Catenulispora pinistramenti]MBS2548936.1 hypothetical protein [Catenulispora pinistramenti]